MEIFNNKVENLGFGSNDGDRILRKNQKRILSVDDKRGKHGIVKNDSMRRTRGKRQVIERQKKCKCSGPAHAIRRGAGEKESENNRSNKNGNGWPIARQVNVEKVR
jgi:hypothetical protein